MQRLSVVLLCSLLIFAGCSSTPRYVTDPSKRPQKSTRGGSKSKSRSTPTRKPKPAKVANIRVGQVITGISSFYGPDFHGKLTANGEVYDMYGRTAAHKTIPLNTIVRVTNLTNQRTIIVRINDRGPYIAGRMLDLSYGAAKKLGFLQQGTTRVKIEIIEVGDNEYIHHLPAEK
ncbi:septal ring lytic transglycosylase RlpA family protein [Candidatus Neomarinimicrobiota bacterium]